MSQEINQGRRHFVGRAAVTVAAAQLAMTALADANPQKAAAHKEEGAINLATAAASFSSAQQMVSGEQDARQ
jgi:hypothetical protein